MKILKVDVKSECVHREREEKKWGSWRAVFVCEVTGARWVGEMDEPQSYSNEVAYVEIEGEGDEVFVLSVNHSEGDSFGYSSGHLFPAIASNSTEYLEEVKSYILNDEWKWYGYTHSTRNYETDEVTTETCKYPIYDFPWNDYFAHVKDVEITLVEVDPSE